MTQDSANKKIVIMLSVILGLIFFIAGVAKIFSYTAFSHTISEVTNFSQTFTSVLAWTVIIVEIIGGIALIFRFNIIKVSLIFVVLISIFLWVLSTAIFKGTEINCSCFGILNIGLSNKEEATLDIALLNLFVLLIFLSSKKTAENSLKQKLLTGIILVIIFYLQYSVFSPLYNVEKDGIKESDVGYILLFLNNNENAFYNYRYGNRLLFLLYFPDFNCPPCFDDFIYLSDFLRVQSPNKKIEKAIAIFKSDAVVNKNDTTRLQRWVKANEIGFPVLIGEDSLFQRINFVKSCVLVIDPLGRVLLSEKLPLGNSKVKKITELLEQ